ncbi:MAG: hypothetical protein ACTTH5_02255 [Wolinella sp.]
METKPSYSKEGEEVRLIIMRRQLQMMARRHAKAFALLIKVWLKGAKE